MQANSQELVREKEQAKAAFGGAKQPAAVYSFGEDEDEVRVTLPPPDEAPKPGAPKKPAAGSGGHRLPAGAR